MKTFITVPCTSNDEFDLQECTAFLDRDSLEKILKLIQDIKEQRSSSSILQEMSYFSFYDKPNFVQEEYQNDTGEEIGEEIFLVTEIDNDTEGINIYYSNLIIVPEKEFYSFYYRMEVKHCSTIIYTNSINENTLKDILKQWNQDIQDNDNETEGS